MTEYSPEVVEEICDRIGSGESLRAICEDPHMPDARNVHRWLASEDEKYGAFRQQYAHARDVQADTKFDQAWTIAKAATAETVQVARLQVDTIKWQAGKLAPKKYGDKLDLEHGGGLTVIVRKFGEG